MKFNYLKYLTIPYMPKSSSFSGCDCLGLVRLFYKEEFNIVIPEFDSYIDNGHLTNPINTIKQARSWGLKKTSEVKPGYIIIISDEAEHKHLGVYILPGYVLHTTYHGTALGHQSPLLIKSIYYHQKVNYDN